MDVAPTIQSGGGASFEVVSIHATSLITLSLVSLFIIVLVSVLRVFYHLLGHRVRLFRDAPESAMVIVVGVILGAILFWGGLDPKQLEFNPELLLVLTLLQLVSHGVVVCSCCCCCCCCCCLLSQLVSHVVLCFCCFMLSFLVSCCLVFLSHVHCCGLVL